MGGSSCGIHIGILSNLPVTYIWHLRDIFIAGTYIAEALQIKVTFCCFLLLWEVLWSLYVGYSGHAVGHIFTMWQANYSGL